MTNWWKPTAALPPPPVTCATRRIQQKRLGFVQLCTQIHSLSALDVSVTPPASVCFTVRHHAWPCPHMLVLHRNGQARCCVLWGGPAPQVLSAQEGLPEGGPAHYNGNVSEGKISLVHLWTEIHFVWVLLERSIIFPDRAVCQFGKFCALHCSPAPAE